MSNIFEIIPGNSENRDSHPLFSLGIKLKIGKHDTVCPLTESLSHDDLESVINSLVDELSDIKKKLESVSREKMNQGALGIDDDSSPEEIWAALSAISDISLLSERFNTLPESRRREAADYIFANCNMFTGKGAYFSERYVQETALLTE